LWQGRNIHQLTVAIIISGRAASYNYLMHPGCKVSMLWDSICQIYTCLQKLECSSNGWLSIAVHEEDGMTLAMTGKVNSLKLPKLETVHSSHSGMMTLPHLYFAHHPGIMIIDQGQHTKPTSSDHRAQLHLLEMLKIGLPAMF
jgi:hypothetical protein